jgi:transposase
MRRQRLPREAAAIIKLRRYGYSKSILAKARKRSTSFIQKILQNAEKRGVLRHFDYRKMPNETRIISRALQWTRIMRWLPHWEKWICGEGDKPP